MRKRVPGIASNTTKELRCRDFPGELLDQLDEEVERQNQSLGGGGPKWTKTTVLVKALKLYFRQHGNAHHGSGSA